MSQTEQRKMLQDAITRFGNKTALAFAMGRPLSTVAEWCKTRKVAGERHFIELPEWARLWIRMQVYEQPLPKPTPAHPWLEPGWPKDRRVARAVRQIDRLVRQDEKKLKLVLDMLDSLVEEE